MQIERANQEVKQREAEVEKKLAEAKQALEEAAQREAGARRATAELQRLDKQLSARKLDAKELQVATGPQVAYIQLSNSAGKLSRGLVHCLPLQSLCFRGRTPEHFGPSYMDPSELTILAELSCDA